MAYPLECVWDDLVTSCLPGIIDSQISGGRWVLGVMLPQTVVWSAPGISCLSFQVLTDLGSFYLCRVTIMVAGSLVDHILDLEIRSVTTAPLHDQDRRWLHSH